MIVFLADLVDLSSSIRCFRRVEGIPEILICVFIEKLQTDFETSGGFSGLKNYCNSLITHDTFPSTIDSAWKCIEFCIEREILEKVKDHPGCTKHTIRDLINDGNEVFLPLAECTTCGYDCVSTNLVAFFQKENIKEFIMTNFKQD
ncbi:hypothetical protein CDAR_622221 [Caerostris darwini]|uniref:Uncharacterized protein n=1 Tax=Caerostris darwini TaxID=1538125 RepID=A0AAV4QE68_9ARAC|nr:hypothetical protein CDAR_622221 [Caerostris darwini]